MPISTRKRTFDRLDEAYEQAPRVPLNMKKDRYVIFSDMHYAGKYRRIDKFARNELIYCHALQHYYDEGFNLVLNGDVEEGWQAKIGAVIRAYKDTAYAMERLYSREGFPRHIRIIGNHDNLWLKQAKVEKYLWPVLGKIDLRMGLRLGDDIFITHGHLGEWLGDEIAWASAWAIRHGWRWLQVLLRFTTARAATNHMVRARRDDLLYNWAKSRGLMTIAGHTHRSMFGDVPESNQLVALLRQLEEDLPDHPSPFQAQATIQYLRKQIQSVEKKEKAAPVPCYFNSGSCVNTNGITGIEIDRGKIRLVRWELSDAQGEEEYERREDGLLFTIERRIYQSANLADVLHRVRRQPGEVEDAKTKDAETAAA